MPGGYGYNVFPANLEQVSFLVDGWEYYPGQLLSSSDFEGGSKPEQYTYIGDYANFSDSLGSPYGTATYRLTLENPGEPTELALYLPELLCAERIYINGVLIGEQGSLEPYAPRVVDGVYALAVGTLGAISRMLTLRLVVYGLLCFTALAISLFHLVQWLLGNDKLTRCMGMLSLAFALRVSYPFIRALGIPSVRPLYALEDVCGNVVLLCAILLAGELSGSRERRYHRYGAVPSAAALCLFEEVDGKTQGINVLLRERRELLANLLHDLKNPLSALRSYAELVRSGNVALDPETSEYLKALMDRVEAVGDRFDILQDFSRGEREVHPPEVICLNHYLWNSYQSNLPDMELSGLPFRLSLPIGTIFVKGKPDRLRIALENLCYNALFFTPADGTVTLGLAQEETYAVITVQDLGTGIAAEDLPHVFERGFTHRTDHSGDGLGLYLVRVIALEHGGSVDAVSQLGRGSTFTLRLPAL